MRAFLVCLGLAACLPMLAGEGLNQLTREEKKDGWILLFDGKNLKGWDGDPAAWSVENGAIVACTDRHSIKQNTFLIYQRRFADLIMRAEVRLRNGNSGIQFRSTVLPGWVVMGYQADFSEAGKNSAWGNFYEERGRRRTIMKTPDEGWQKAKSVVRVGDWNTYEIFAQGSRVRLKLNGVETVDATDSKASEGVVALQLHAGPPMKVEFRNLKLKPLR